jgi:DNA-binding GntR family transcriptional regulator
MTDVRCASSVEGDVASDDTASPSLSDLVFDRISSAIVMGHLDFGEPLSEGELAKALGVGKAPVRSAITELKQRKLVDIVPQSGTYVVSPSADDVRALCRFRFALEALAVQAAMADAREALLADLKGIVSGMREAFAKGDMPANKRLDSEWHWTFVKHAANRYLSDAYAEISLLVEALRYRFMDTATFRNQAFAEHQQMLDHLHAGQTVKAVDMLRAHIERTERYQSTVTWSEGRSPRRHYRMRNYAVVLGTQLA